MALKDDDLNDTIEHFLFEIKVGQFQSASTPTLIVAKRAAELLRNVVGHIHKANIDELLKTVKRVGRRLAEGSRPFNMVIDNITRRVLYIIREEYENVIRDPSGEGGSSLPTRSLYLDGSMERISSCLSVDLDDSSPSIFENSPTSPTSSTSAFAIEQPTIDSTEPLAAIRRDNMPPSAPIAIPQPSSHSDERVSPSDSVYGGSFTESSAESGLASPGLSPMRRVLSSLNPNLQSMMEPCSLNTHNPNTQEVLWTKGRLKQNVILHINEYIVEELTDIYKNICDQAKDHLNDNERILTLGYSCVVEAFLKHGLKKRTFEVIVAEHSPECDGFKMAKALAEAGIQVTLIPDASIFAMMSRVNKILVGAHAVLANGGVMGRSGTHMMAVAAKAHRLPLVVLAGHYKLSPIFPVNPLQFSDMVSPSSLIPYEMVQKINPQKHLGPDAAQFHVINPHCDYVPPSAIHTYITNNGVHSPSYIYRLMAELYNPEDYEL